MFMREWAASAARPGVLIMTIRVSASLAERLAPIVLPEVMGGEVRLGSLWEQGPAVVVFLRHYG